MLSAGIPKLQNCLASSTAESEYYGIVECTKECLWLKNMLCKLKIKDKIFED